MSISSNQGPLRRAERSESQHSLYTENSDHSDSPPLRPQQKPSQEFLPKEPSIVVHPFKQTPQIVPPIEQTQIIQPVQKTPQKKQENLKSLPRFPEIKSNSNKSALEKGKNLFNNSFVNDAAERHALFNEKLSSVEIKQDKASKANFFLSKNQGLSEKDKSFKRYGPVDNLDNQGQRFLGSGQGSRWIRSQSLTVSRQQKNFKFLVRHFHRHNSVMVESLNRFWEHFQLVEKQLNMSAYRLSLYDSLESIKLKMEGYLERRINLGNFKTEKPTPEWSQQQFMAYFGNYQKIYLQEHESQVHRPYTLKKYKNCVFFGKMMEGKKEEGILHYFNGKCFQGRFKDDQKQFGLEIDEKQLYLGDFKKGLRHGEGILKTTEALFVGRFTYGQFTTIAQNKEESGTTSLFANPTNQKANIQNRKGFEITLSLLKVYQSGLCITKNNTGDIFIGNLNDEGEKHEEGLQVFANGDIYIGRYESDSPEGYGEYYWENGSNYRGQFLSGMRHGRGVWQMINGDSYEGEYMNDKKNGKGTYLWKNGSRYVGNFENDYRHGYGEMYWQDGKVYKGKWLNGIEKNTLITLDNPKAKVVAKQQTNPRYQRPAFRTIQQETAQRKRVPLDKLKSLYNPSYH